MSLKEIGVAPADIKFLAMSHTHADHSGNGNLFTSATLYVQESEYNAAFGAEPQKTGFVAANYERLRDESAPEALRFRGTYAQLCGKQKQARALWERAISVGERLGAGYSLARTHLEVGRWTGSREHLEQAELLLARASLQFHLEQARQLLQQPA